jgi:hypothetical protein
VYKNKGWKGLGDWLGTEAVATRNREYLSYKKAKEFVSKLNIGTYNVWREYCKSGKKPIDLPNAPNSVYKNKGWKDWADFLGKE